MLIGDRGEVGGIGEEERGGVCVGGLEGYGVEVRECVVRKVVGEREGWGMLWNGSGLGERIVKEDLFEYGKMCCKKYGDIGMVGGSEVIEGIEECYGDVGLDERIVMCGWKKGGCVYNKGIRNRVV